MLFGKTKTQDRTSLSDEVLIQRYKDSDDKLSFSELYKRYRHLVFGVCLKYLENKDRSEDVVMDVFERILKNPPGEEITSFKAWLYKTTQNECLWRLRKEKNRGDLMEDFTFSEKKSEKFMENEGLTLLINNKYKDESEMMDEAIKQLPEEQRTCIQLFYVNKKSYKEIETQTKLEAKQVKSALQNGKRNLKNIISAMMNE